MVFFFVDLQGCYNEQSAWNFNNIGDCVHKRIDLGLLNRSSHYCDRWPHNRRTGLCEIDLSIMDMCIGNCSLLYFSSPYLSPFLKSIDKK